MNTLTSLPTLNTERKRQLITAALGISISWALAGLMACAAHIQEDRLALYEQLGGVDAITAITDRTLDRVSTDARSKRTFAHIKMKALKESVAAYVCQVADGPCHYEGVSMKQSHADLNIKGSEFELMVEILREELNKAQVPEGAKNELLKRLAPTRQDIVR